MRKFRITATGFAFIFAAGSCWAAIPIDANGKLLLSGDVRGRIELDWDSKRSNGTERDDRSRMRARFRATLEYQASDKISVVVRLRSGSDDSQQSPHITILDFDGNDTGDADFNFDKWYLKYSSGNFSAWLGRNSMNFWKSDELVFDDDITPAGIGLALKTGHLTVNAGYYSNPVGMHHFTGNTGILQAVFNTSIGATRLTFAAGVADIDAEPGNPNNALLLDNNGVRDYTLWVGNVEAAMQFMDRPLQLNLDLLHNSQSYSATDPDSFTAFHRKQTDGYILSVRLGDTSERGHWLFGYFYSHVETFAVNNSLAEDDWLRWGSATQARASNFKGSEFRVATKLGNSLNVVARLYLVEGIKLRSATSLTREDGNRFRVDLNWSF